MKAYIFVILHFRIPAQNVLLLLKSLFIDAVPSVLTRRKLHFVECSDTKKTSIRGVFWHEENFISWSVLTRRKLHFVECSDMKKTSCRGVFWHEENFISWSVLTGRKLHIEECSGMKNTSYRGVFWHEEKLISWCSDNNKTSCRGYIVQRKLLREGRKYLVKNIFWTSKNSYLTQQQYLNYGVESSVNQGKIARHFY